MEIILLLVIIVMLRISDYASNSSGCVKCCNFGYLGSLVLFYDEPALQVRLTVTQSLCTGLDSMQVLPC